MIKNTMLLLITVFLIVSCSKFNPTEEKLSLPKTCIPMPTQCSIDSINGISINQKQQPIITVSLNQNVIVTGWAVDVLAKGAAGGVIIDIDGKLYSSFYGGDRLDVSDYYKNTEYRYSSFITSIPAIRIGPGKHTLSLKIITKDTTAYYSPEQKVVFELK